MINVIGIIFAVAVLVLILTLLLQRRLREKYAFLWLVIGIAFLIFALFPGLLTGLAAFLGVAVPSNLLFAMVLALLIGVCLHLSWELSTAEEEIRRVAEEVAILRAQPAQAGHDTAAGSDQPGAGSGRPDAPEQPGDGQR